MESKHFLYVPKDIFDEETKKAIPFRIAFRLLDLFSDDLFSKVHGVIRYTSVMGNNVDKVDSSLCRTFTFVKAFDMGLSENAFHIVDFFMAFNQTLSFLNIIVFYTIKGILDECSCCLINLS